MQESDELLAIRANGVTNVEAGSGDSQLQRVRDTQTEQATNNEAGVEVVTRARADLRLGRVRSIDEYFALRVGAGGVADRVDDAGMNLELLANRGGERGGALRIIGRLLQAQDLGDMLALAFIKAEDDVIVLLKFADDFERRMAGRRRGAWPGRPGRKTSACAWLAWPACNR